MNPTGGPQADVLIRSEAGGRGAKAAEVTLTFDDNRFASVAYGEYDQNIARIERRLGVSATANGNVLVIRGPRDSCERAKKVFEVLYGRAKAGQSPGEGDVEGVIAESAYQATLFPGVAEKAADGFGQVKTRFRGAVRARNAWATA